MYALGIIKVSKNKFLVRMHLTDVITKTMQVENYSESKN